MNAKMDRFKIAKSLLRIARAIVADNVADAAGDYRDFTGVIDWYQNSGEVSGATLTLKPEDKSIDWQDSTWEDGNWENGVWKDGVWKEGNWEDGVWNRGDWKSGV